MQKEGDMKWGKGKKRCDNRTFVFQNVINEQVFILMKCKT